MTATIARRGRSAIVALAAATVLTLSGCGGDDSAEFDSGDQQADETSTDQTTTEDPADETPESPTPDETATPEDDDASGSGTESRPSGVGGPEDAIDSVTYEVPGESETTVEVGLHGLRVEGEVMLLELSFTGEFYGDDERNIYHMMNEAVYPQLNDRENLKQYTVLGSGHDRWSTDSTNSGDRYESGQTVPYWAYYAAPVDDIDTITVSVIPGAVEFEDVEIER